MTSIATSLLKIDTPWNPASSNILIGKDVLELLSTAMYVDPMSIYREYLQNAADAIEQAHADGVLDREASGVVTLDFDDLARSVRIRDNGIGIRSEEVETRLTSFGASKKRGLSLRGFRGVGRLGGIGHCQELVFRTRARGDSYVSEIKWDCRRIKSLLHSLEFAADLRDMIGHAVTSRKISNSGEPAHFFEVELRGIVRYRDDRLMNSLAVENYLSQTAPIAFSPGFKFGKRIECELQSHVPLENLDIRIAGRQQVFRPHQNTFMVRENVFDSVKDVEFVRVAGPEGNLAAIGWVIHHSYLGAIPPQTRIRGLRLRVGNVQIGEANLLEELFSEPRFNSWSVGEIHILDSRIVPNGRRDQFEQNVHFLNVLNHLAPVARDISLRCRRSSMRRNWFKTFEKRRSLVRDKISLVKQGGLSKVHRSRLLSEAKQIVVELERIASKDALNDDVKLSLHPSIRHLNQMISKIDVLGIKKGPLARMRGSRKKAFEEVFSLIYECTPNESIAKNLIAKILCRIT